MLRQKHLCHTLEYEGFTLKCYKNALVRIRSYCTKRIIQTFRELFIINVWQIAARIDTFTAARNRFDNVS